MEKDEIGRDKLGRLLCSLINHNWLTVGERGTRIRRNLLISSLYNEFYMILTHSLHGTDDVSHEKLK